MRLQVADTDIPRDRGTLFGKCARRIHSLVQDPHVLARPSGQAAAIHRLFTPIVDYTLPVERHMISPSTLCRPHYSFNWGYSGVLAGNKIPGNGQLYQHLTEWKISMDLSGTILLGIGLNVKRRGPIEVPVL
jgi:hypothetical protein